DFKKKEVVGNELPQRISRLVVGRVGLEGQALLVQDGVLERFYALRVEWVELGVAKIHAGLGDHGHDAAPGVAQAALLERLLMGPDRLLQAVHGRNVERVQLFRFSARDGDFGAYDIDQ